MVIQLTEKDNIEISRCFEDLNCSLLRQVIWGTLKISCSLDCNKLELITDDSHEFYIEDTYDIRIDFNRPDTFGFPIVIEDSCKIEEFARANAIELQDLHVNMAPKNSCCLGIFPEYQWSGAAAFILDKITPFFYWQSFRRLFGREPWKAFSHGAKGLEEAMCLPVRESSKGRNRNISCPCGSGNKYKNCCMKRDTMIKREIMHENKLHFLLKGRK